MKRTLLFLILTASLVSLSLFGAGELSHRRAPGFSIRDTVQQQHDLADYRGKYVILDFMQTACPHCITVGEVIEKLMIKHRPKLAALSIVVPPDNMQTMTNYIKQHNVTIPVLFDCSQVAASYLKLGPNTPHVYFPHLFIVDPNGNIIYDDGSTADKTFDGEGLAKEIDQLLAGKK